MYRIDEFKGHSDPAFQDAISWRRSGNTLYGRWETETHGIEASHCIDEVGGITTARANVAWQLWQALAQTGAQ